MQLTKSPHNQHAKKIWIDLENSPHVLFFDPIIKELKKRGYEVIVTARDYAQVIGLADLFNLEYRKIGHHYGKKPLWKIAGLLIRTCQLVPVALSEKPDLAFSHGSRAQLLAAGLTGVPAVHAFDYEYTRNAPFFRPCRVIIPEVLTKSITDHKANEISPYPGIKEDVYVQDHIPEPAFLKSLGIEEEAIIASIRPPATAAHYYVEKSNALFQAAVEYLASQPETRVIIVPRTEQQAAAIRNRWSLYLASGRLVIPDRVVNGLDLIWHSDLVISAGGTMIREATALGVPAYSIFGGKIGAVDHYLAETGRLTLIAEPAEVAAKIQVKKWSRPSEPDHARRPALQTIVDAIEDMLETSPEMEGASVNNQTIHHINNGTY